MPTMTSPVELIASFPFATSAAKAGFDKFGSLKEGACPVRIILDITRTSQSKNVEFYGERVNI